MLDPQRAIDALVLQGKLQGQLTHDEIIEALSPFDVGPDQFDAILERFVTEGIEVIDDSDDDYPVERAQGEIEFDAGARELLKWATWIALCGEAQEVENDHLLAAARADCQPPEPTKIWDIPFSALTQLSLAQACLGSTLITRNRILTAIGFESTRSRLSLSEALGEKLRHLLKKWGVNTSDLWGQLEDFEAHDCIPKPEFSASEAGRRWQRIASEVGNQPLGHELAFLLYCILADTVASSVLKNAGVTEDLVDGLLKDFPRDVQPFVEVSLEIRRLVAGEPLSPDSLISLELAWRFSDRKQLRPDDLLPTLLVYGSQSAHILETLDSLQGIAAAIPPRVRLVEGAGASPSLSPEIQTVLEIARQAAGDSPVDTGHLLLGLAEFGHPLVTQLKQQIREAL